MSYGEQKLIESLKKEVDELREENRRLNRQNKPSSDMKAQEVAGVGLAVGASALLIADYLKERKKEKEDDRYQRLCLANHWTQEDQDKYGNCDLYGIKRRYADKHGITVNEVTKLMLHGKVGYILDIK